MKFVKSSFLYLSLCSFCAIFSEPSLSEKDYIRKIESHLYLQQPEKAASLCEEALHYFPSSSPIYEGYLSALSFIGEEEKILHVWEAYIEREVKAKENRKALQNLAWGILQDARLSHFLGVQSMALLGMAAAQDGRAISPIIEALQSPNAFLRSLAIYAASHFKDHPIATALLQRLKEEKLWYIRLQLIETLGRMQLYAAREELQNILTRKDSTTEEKATTILALVQMYDRVSTKELEYLIASPYSGLRQLAAQLVLYFKKESFLPFLEKLLHDPHPEVRSYALYTFSLLSYKIEGKLIHALMQDSVALVSITASWYALRQGEMEGGEKLVEWISSRDTQIANIAAAALTQTGSTSLLFLTKLLQDPKITDPCLLLNLARGLIYYRTNLQEAGNVIYKQLEKQKVGLWMWNMHPLFPHVAPSEINYYSHIPNLPKIMDQQVRLEWIYMLYLTAHPKAKEMVEKLLKAGNLTSTRVAAAALLNQCEQEKAEGLVEFLETVLKEEKGDMQLQIALLLQQMQAGKEASKLLFSQYKQASYSMKMQILESMGSLSITEDSLSFLLEGCKEPFQSLRLLAAASLLQSLYE